jgi:hypothetical protein
LPKLALPRPGHRVRRPEARRRHNDRQALLPGSPARAAPNETSQSSPRRGSGNRRHGRPARPPTSRAFWALRAPCSPTGGLSWTAPTSARGKTRPLAGLRSADLTPQRLSFLALCVGKPWLIAPAAIGPTIPDMTRASLAAGIPDVLAGAKPLLNLPSNRETTLGLDRVLGPFRSRPSETARVGGSGRGSLRISGAAFVRDLAQGSNATRHGRRDRRRSPNPAD